MSGLALRRGGPGLVVVVVLMATAGCGISSDAKPRALSADGLPAALSANPSGTTLPEPGRVGTELVKLFLVKTTGDAEALVSQPTPIPIVADRSRLPRVVIEQLIAQQPANAPGGPTIINAIPPTVRVLKATVNGNILDLDMSDLGTVESTRQRQAAAQIVFTATALAGIDAVRFFVNGQPTTVPLDSQQSVAGRPVTRGDYPKLQPVP